uniref:Uncharacterized protein n=1 Tax=Cannabis sativa TaxID=3483 RepID=A0A803NG82_CANSA
MSWLWQLTALMLVLGSDASPPKGVCGGGGYSYDGRLVLGCGFACRGFLSSPIMVSGIHLDPLAFVNLV